MSFIEKRTIAVTSNIDFTVSKLDGEVTTRVVHEIPVVTWEILLLDGIPAPADPETAEFLRWFDMEQKIGLVDFKAFIDIAAVRRSGATREDIFREINEAIRLAKEVTAVPFEESGLMV